MLKHLVSTARGTGLLDVPQTDIVLVFVVLVGLDSVHNRLMMMGVHCGETGSEGLVAVAFTVTVWRRVERACLADHQFQPERRCFKLLTDSPDRTQGPLTVLRRQTSFVIIHDFLDSLY